MTKRMKYIFATIKANQLRWWSFTLFIPCIYYTLLMLSLIMRFQELPNYVNFYNWPKNIVRILESTPSLRDSLFIMRDEWLLEIGYMNYDFGMGLSEWSLVLMPSKLFLALIWSALMATYFVMARDKKGSDCERVNTNKSKTLTGIGAILLAFSSVTMSWVVCCATPTWVIGLTILGLGASTALLIEPLGLWLQWSGYIVLILACYFISESSSRKTKVLT